MGGAAGLPTSTTATGEAGEAVPTTDAVSQETSALEAYRPALTTLQGYEGYQNPFRSAPGTASNSSPYIAVPGYERIRNPFYSPYQQQPTTTGPSASELAAQYQAYTQGYAKDIQAAKDQRIADARAAEQAYQTARGNEAIKAEYEKKLADQKAWYEQAQPQTFYYDAGWYGGGASGGIASLQKGFKR